MFRGVNVSWCACVKSVALIQPRPSIQVIREEKNNNKETRRMDKKNDGRTKEIFRSWAERVTRARADRPRLAAN